MKKYQINPILQLMNSDITLHVNRLLAHAIGMNETIIYSTLISKFTYYSIKEMIDDDGWFYSTAPDIQESTTFSEKVQRRAINNLIETGLIESELHGMPAKRYFRILNNIDLLENLINKGADIANKIKIEANEKNIEKVAKRNKRKDDENNETQFRQNGGTSSDQRAEQVPPKGQDKFRQNAGTCSCEVQDKSKSNKSKSNKSKSNQSVCHRAENEKGNIDRLTDRPHQKSFSEILDEINYKSRFMPESENDCSEPDAEAVKKCSVPYEFKDDKKTMKRALMFLFGFNYYSEGMNEQDKELFLQVITLIAEIAVSDSKLGGRTVKYHEVISRLNELIANNMLYDWFLSFIPEWNTICQERKIKNVRAYLKACIWSWLNEYEIIENSLSRSIPEIVYSSDTSETQGNASTSDFCTYVKEITPSDRKPCHEPVRPNRNDFEKTEEIIESSISKNIPEKVCSSDTYETQKDDFPDEEADYFFRHGKTEDDMTDMFLKPSVPFEEKVAWLDEFVENWRNSEQHFIFSSVRFEFEKRNSHV